MEEKDAQPLSCLNWWEKQFNESLLLHLLNALASVLSFPLHPQSPHTKDKILQILAVKSVRRQIEYPSGLLSISSQKACVEEWKYKK